MPDRTLAEVDAALAKAERQIKKLAKMIKSLQGTSVGMRAREVQIVRGKKVTRLVAAAPVETARGHQQKSGAKALRSRHS
jgi:hypothetical protein